MSRPTGKPLGGRLGDLRWTTLVVPVVLSGYAVSSSVQLRYVSSELCPLSGVHTIYATTVREIWRLKAHRSLGLDCFKGRIAGSIHISRCKNINAPNINRYSCEDV